MVIQDIPHKNVDKWVRKVALEHNISSEPDRYGRMALKITELAGDEIAVGLTERLIINLHKQGFLTIEDAINLVGIHLEESRATKKNLHHQSSPEPH